MERAKLYLFPLPCSSAKVKSAPRLTVDVPRLRIKSFLENLLRMSRLSEIDPQKFKPTKRPITLECRINGGGG